MCYTYVQEANEAMMDGGRVVRNVMQEGALETDDEVTNL